MDRDKLALALSIAKRSEREMRNLKQILAQLADESSETITETQLQPQEAQATNAHRT